MITRDYNTTGIVATDRKDYQAKYNKANKEKVAALKKQHRLANLDKYRNQEYLRNYAITLADYDALYYAQDGFCRLCGIHEHETGSRLVVEHCHQTGKVRSLACRDCNSILGLARESKQTLQNCIDYLNQHNSN